MIIDQTSNFQPLLKACLEQLNLIEKITIAAKDGFVPDLLRVALRQDRWPFAIDPAYLADPNSDADKLSRAQNIFSIILPPHMQNKKFLDFGCGEGHVVKVVSENGATAVGYDIVDQSWSKLTGSFLLTTDWSEITNRGPYDVVLIYDVLDHIADRDWVEELKKVVSVLAPNGVIFVRCHPWCSRHGTHLYHQINKAFVHIIFSEEELTEMNLKGLPTRKIIHPLDTYEALFKNAGLKMNAEPWVTREPVENFFEQPMTRERVVGNWKSSPQPPLASGEVFPIFQMEQQFIDYVLVRA